MKELQTLMRFEPTLVKGKWFEVNDPNSSAMDNNN
jgi:hypothetical protein